MEYWHDHSLRYPLREVAARYPKTYQKVGNQLRELGLTSDEKSREESKSILKKQWIAALAAMPPHVQPYKDMGDTKTWAQQDWTSVFTAIEKEVA
tara:strand:- start:1894 stop:2178 length:285 start_codon:yes stop_codon:yes gene_type:complete